MVFKKKGVKPSSFNNYGKGSTMKFPTKSMNQHKFPSESGNKTFGSTSRRTESINKVPLNCWGFGEENIVRDFPHKKPRRESTTSKRLPQLMMWLVL